VLVSSADNCLDAALLGMITDGSIGRALANGCVPDAWPPGNVRNAHCKGRRAAALLGVTA
jgi:hypothetical protein